MILSTSKMAARAGVDTWTNTLACKHYFPGDGLSQGRLVDIKGGVVANPQTGKEFVYDSSLFATGTTADVFDEKAALYAGEFAELAAGRSALFLTAGYLDLDPTLIPGGFAVRTAVGDFVPGGNWGMSDGDSDVGGAAGHVLMDDNTLQNGSKLADSGNTLGEEIQTAVGVGGYFYRYSAYEADAALLEAKAMVDGAAIPNATNDTIYADTNILGALQFAPYFRMSGYKSTGIALFYFDSLPADYEVAMQTMAEEWANGNRFIWPYW